MIRPLLKKNDRLANILIITFSVIVFAVVFALGQLPKDFIPKPDFDVHIFARINAGINSIVSVLLVIAFVLVRRKNFAAHRNVMLLAMGLSVLFLVSYITHHLLAGEARFGDMDHNGILDDAEKLSAGSARYVYYVLLSTHILLASIILPFILYTAYRSLSGEYQKHKKLARYTFPLWLYVSITGVIVYFMIAPYYF